MFDLNCPVCQKKTKFEVDKVLHYEKKHRDLTAIIHCIECSTSHSIVSYDQYSPPPRR